MTFHLRSSIKMRLPWKVVAWYVSYLPGVSRGSSIIPNGALLRSETIISNVILDVQAGEFFFIGAILHHIRAGMFATRASGSRHARFAACSSCLTRNQDTRPNLPIALNFW